MMSSMSWVVGLYSSALVVPLPVEWCMLLACLRSDCLVLEQLFLGLAVTGGRVASSCWSAVPVRHSAISWLCYSSIGLLTIPCIRSSSTVGVVLVAAFVVGLRPVAVEVVHVAFDCSTSSGANVGCSRTPKETGKGCSARSRGN